MVGSFFQLRTVWGTANKRNKKDVSLTCYLVHIPLKIFQTVAQHLVFLSIGITHAISVGLLLHELRAKGHNL